MPHRPDHDRCVVIGAVWYSLSMRRIVNTGTLPEPY